MSHSEAIILGIIQGLTEFFPISSSAHLMLAKIILGIDLQQNFLFFDLICHLGTTFAVIFFLRDEIQKIFKQKRVLLLYFVALLPLIPIYLFTKSYLGFFSDPKFLSFFLFFSALLLFFASFTKEKKESSQHKIKDVVFIGMMQAMALIPGISRSGSTIAAGCFRGWKIKEALLFTYLLAIPTIIGGSFLEILKHIQSPAVIPMHSTVYLLGFFSSLILGMLGVRLIFWFLSKNRLRIFTAYLLLLGVFAYFIT